MVSSHNEAATPVDDANCQLLTLLVAFVASILCASQLLHLQSWPASHEGLRYSFLIDHVADSMLHGRAYPRFLPNACGGYGYPTFVFYPPGFFLLASPLACLTGSTLMAVFLTVLFALFTGCVGAYRVSRLFCADPVVAMGCSLLYMTTPYVYSNLHVRGDLSELLATMVLPWPIYFAMAPARSGFGCRRFLLAVSAAAIVLAHPLVAMPFFPMACSLVLLGSKQPWNVRLRDCFAIMVGAGIASPYWLPVMLLKDSVVNQAAFQGYFRFDNHFVCWWQFISPKWGYGDSSLGCSDGMSFQLGLPHAVLSLAGGMIAIKQSRHVRMIGVFYLLLIFMMTRASTGVWEQLPILQKMQFPWRLLSVTSVCQLVLICQLCSWLNSLTVVARRSLIACFVFSFVLWYWPAFFPSPGIIQRADLEITTHRKKWLNTMNTYAGTNEFLPLTATEILDAPPVGDNPIVESVPACRIDPLPGHSRHSIHVQLNASRPTTLILNQLYFPGWRVTIDGNSIPINELSLTTDGRMQFPIHETGLHVIHASYTSPPGQSLGIVIGIMLVTVLLFVESRARPPHAPDVTHD